MPSYFGIDGKPDYPGALQCFEAKKLWGFAALMYLNGEGAPRDLNKASAALEKWQQEKPGIANSDIAETLKKAIRACKQHPHSCPRLDYCKGLAESKQEIEICDAVDQLAAEKALTREIAVTKSGLNAPDRNLFNQVVVQFKAYQLDEMQRQYLYSGGAPMNDLAGAGQAEFVREKFVGLMSSTIQARKLKPVTVGEYNAVSRELQREFRCDIDDYVAGSQDEINEITGRRDLSDYDKSHLQDLKSYIVE
jgi:hypothetical protein